MHKASKPSPEGDGGCHNPQSHERKPRPSGRGAVTREEIEGLGYVFARQIPSGEWLGIQKMLFTTGLFVITEDGGSWRTRFCYEHSIDAVLAALEWDGTGDPPGPWVKQKPEDRPGPGMAPFIKRGTHLP